MLTQFTLRQSREFSDSMRAFWGIRVAIDTLRQEVRNGMAVA